MSEREELRDPETDVAALVAHALAEDVGRGDITSELVVDAEVHGRAVIRAKAEGVISGLRVVREVFRQVDPDLVFEPLVGDSDRVEKASRVAGVTGRARAILTAERTALNFLQRLSGIATLTARYVTAVEGTGARILDTRKTTPTLRWLEKQAVAHGGGANHRFGLFDAMLIKDNHIAAAGGLEAALAGLRGRRPDVPVIVEVCTLEEVRLAATASVDRILLDNFEPEQIEAAVVLLDELARTGASRPEIEVSGGVTLESVSRMALPGVNFISVGALTHSAPALDIALDLVREI